LLATLAAKKLKKCEKFVESFSRQEVVASICWRLNILLADFGRDLPAKKWKFETFNFKKFVRFKIIFQSIVL
jgi:hypothetical protein